MIRTEEYKFMKEAFKDIPRHKVATNNGGFIMTLFYTKYNFNGRALLLVQIITVGLVNQTGATQYDKRRKKNISPSILLGT